MGVSLWSDEQERPVQHLRVIDMTVMIPGPFLTRLLAQYGADVIKVEATPDGDPLRHWPETAVFEFLNQGKRSVAIDLKSETGKQLVRSLAGEADIFIENAPAGEMESLGLGYAELSEENPDLLYVSLRNLSGKGASSAGSELNAIANSGVGEWFLNGGKPNYSTLFGDLVGGAFVPAMKLLFHLANPARRGMHLVTSTDESFRSLYLPRAFDQYKAESLPEADAKNFGLHRYFNGSMAHSRYYQCRDGQWISLNAAQEKHWNAFCEVVDRKAWISRRFDPSLVSEVEKLFQDAPSTYWEALAHDRHVCLVRVIPWNDHMSFSEARPQLATDPMTWAGFAMNTALTPAPTLGRDTFAVAHSVGASNKEIADWIQAGILKGPEKNS